MIETVKAIFWISAPFIGLGLIIIFGALAFRFIYKEDTKNKFEEIENAIKDYNVRISIAVVMLSCIFLFAWGFISSFSFFDGETIENTKIPWWFALLLGYCGLVIAFKLSSLWYNKK